MARNDLKDVVLSLEERVNDLDDQLEEQAEVLYEIKGKVKVLMWITGTLWIPFLLTLIMALIG